MKITKVEALPLRGRGAQGAYGEPYGLIVRIATDSGLIGFGEADSMPSVAKAVIEAPYLNEMMSGLKWVLLGQDPIDIERLWQRMARATLTYSRDGVTVQAMAAIDLALWDIRGKAAGVPVSELLGGARRRTVPVYASHPLGATPEESARIAAAICDTGFRAVKFGWHPLGADADADEAIVRALRGAIGDETELLIDAGLAWDVDTAIERCRRFEPYRLFWLEEPLPAYDFAGYARLAASVETPIAAGEMASTRGELTRLIEEGRIDIVQVDIARVGLTQAMKVAAVAARRGIPCVNHTYSYGINLAASLHFVAAIERTSLFEYQLTPNEIRDVLVPDAPQPVDGAIAVPDAPGLGVTVDTAALERFAVTD
jgi:L-alanine-DL-glutamate epimerase-like enolase superfamily enzyme